MEELENPEKSRETQNLAIVLRSIVVYMITSFTCIKDDMEIEIFFHTSQSIFQIPMSTSFTTDLLKDKIYMLVRNPKTSIRTVSEFTGFDKAFHICIWESKAGIMNATIDILGKLLTFSTFSYRKWKNVTKQKLFPEL